MKLLFYSFFPFFVGAVLFFSVFTISFLAMRKSAYQEFLRLKREFGLRERGLKARFEFTLGLVLLSGMAVSWFWTGRFYFGLGFCLVAPYLFRWVAGMRQRKLYFELDHSALSFFYALRGLIRVGKSLPAALFDLAQSTRSPFADLLLKYLKNYEEGKALPHLLARFRSRSRLELTGIYLSGLETAYRRGLSVTPLLDKMIPTLESEFSSQKRLVELRHSAYIQAAIAFVIPWILLLVFHFFEPAIFAAFAASPMNLVTAGIVLCVESLGVWLIWNLSSFY